MKLKTAYKTLGILSALFGVVLFISTKSPVVGYAITKGNLTINSTMLWGGFFLITGLTLYYLQSKNSS